MLDTETFECRWQGAAGGSAPIRWILESGTGEWSSLFPRLSSRDRRSKGGLAAMHCFCSWAFWQS